MLLIENQVKIYAGPVLKLQTATAAIGLAPDDNEVTSEAQNFEFYGELCRAPETPVQVFEAQTSRRRYVRVRADVVERRKHSPIRHIGDFVMVMALTGIGAELFLRRLALPGRSAD